MQLIRLTQENPIHAIPLEIAGEGFDTIFHSMEIIIMAKAGFHTDTLLARLLMIYLPRVEIKDRGLALDVIQSLQEPF